MDKFCKSVQERAKRIRKSAFPEHTDPYSRHLHIMADYLAKGERYCMIDEEPEHVAGSVYATIGNLWETRQQLSATQAKLDALMMEYCPQDMTPEQVANWEAHQRTETSEDAGT